MTKDEMIDKVIQARGFEDEYTIWFCRLCEWLPYVSEKTLEEYMTLILKRK